MGTLGKVMCFLAVIAAFYILAVFLFFVIEIAKDTKAERGLKYERRNQKKTVQPEVLAFGRRVSGKRGRVNKRHDNK